MSELRHDVTAVELAAACDANDWDYDTALWDYCHTIGDGIMSDDIRTWPDSFYKEAGKIPDHDFPIENYHDPIIDHFAGEAMNALIVSTPTNTMRTSESIALQAYSIADAMVKQRKRYINERRAV